MGYSVQDVNRAIANAKAGFASDYDKKALAYMANSGQAGSLTRDAAYWLEKANKQAR